MTTPKHETEQPKRAVLYARVARTVDGRSASVDAQMARERAFAERHGYDIAGEFTDIGPSASTARKAPGFEAMLERSRAGEVDTLLVEGLARLSRNNAAYFLTVRDELRDLGVNIVLTSEPHCRVPGDHSDLVKDILCYLDGAEGKEVR